MMGPLLRQPTIRVILFGGRKVVLKRCSEKNLSQLQTFWGLGLRSLGVGVEDFECRFQGKL